ncbi:MAG TPA: hypothetical protein VKT72_05195 [Candidatus Baltobacteraceae bacterium]|nr:hypothetical protein [Candidatus Baltobacteraceae bacterium]
MKDLLRFDTVVAACALLMSSVTAGAMVYQTRVLQDQCAAIDNIKEPLQDQSVDGSTAIRAGEDPTLLKMHLQRASLVARSLQHDVTLRFCYSAAPAVPVVAPACSEHYAIAAPSFELVK